MTRESSPPSRRCLPRLLLLGGLCLILVWGGMKAYRLARLARSFQARFYAISEVASSDGWMHLDPEWIDEMVHGTRSDFVALKAEVELWLWVTPAFRWLPAYGADLVLAPQLVAMGDAGTEAGVALADAFLPILEHYGRGELALGALTAHLADARLRLGDAETSLASIAAVRQTIPPGDYAPVTQKALDKLDELLPLAQLSLQAAQLLPDALGAEQRKTYLLVAQNEDEIRPTGGFISSVGVLVVDRGEIVELSFEDSYAVDNWLDHAYPPVPMPFQRVMGDGLWLFRDANWSPDWPSSARQAATLYQINSEIPIDGVVAVDQQAVQLLVGPLAPLQVRQDMAPVTSDNIREFMRQSWFNPSQGVPEQWMQYRKAFIGELAATMQQKLLSDPASVDLSALFAALLTALDERHILLYFEDSELARLVHGAKWDGAIRSDPGDYLMVVDANMGFNKANAVVSQQILYEVSLGESIEGNVTLTYTHSGSYANEPCRQEPLYDGAIDGYSDLINRCYWDYVRIYPAAGAQPLGGTAQPVSGDVLISRLDWPGEVVVTQEPGNRLSMANLMLLDHGSTQEIGFWYLLPHSVLTSDGDRRQYRLLVQKQPGTLGHPLRVVVQLPSGATSLVSTPAASRSGDRLVFDLSLLTDQEITVQWSE